jgi:ketosteroid isomerase-like protein
VRRCAHGATSGLRLDLELAHVWTLDAGKVRRVEEYMDHAEALAAAGLAAP